MTRTDLTIDSWQQIDLWMQLYLKFPMQFFISNIKTQYGIKDDSHPPCCYTKHFIVYNTSPKEESVK